MRAAIIVTGLIGLALRLWILFLPGLMSVTQYDDGPYFGSAVRLVHGVLPYRDYAFVQPPGITELMSPAALESYLGGTAWALVIGRFLCVFAGAAAVVLAGFARPPPRRPGRPVLAGGHHRHLPARCGVRAHRAARTVAGAVLPGRGGCL